MEKIETMKSVFEYIDYRRYLKDFMISRKRPRNTFPIGFSPKKPG